MAALIGALRVTLGLDTAKFSKGAKQARSQMTGLQRSMGGVSSGFKSMAAAFGVGLGVAAITSAATSALEYASSLGEVAQQLGVTTSELQRYRFIASQVGIDQEQMDKGLSFLSKNLGHLALGAKAPAAALKNLGFSTAEIARIAKMTAGEAMPVLADAFAKIESPAKASALAADLFGAKMGGKFLTLLMGGSAGINALAESYRKLGIELSPEQIKRADEAVDKFTALKKVLEAKFAIWIVERLPELQKVTDQLMKLGNELGELGGKADSAAPKVRGFFADITKFTDKHNMLGDLTQQWNAFAAGMTAVWKTALSVSRGVADAVSAIYSAVTTWLVNKMSAQFEWVKTKIHQVGDKFKWLYDVVVGHSYIPDMVDAIGEHMRRLDAKMVQPAKTAADRTAEAFERLRTLLADLFPENTEHNEYIGKLKELKEQLDAGRLSAEEYRTALDRLEKGGPRGVLGEATKAPVEVSDLKDPDSGLADRELEDQIAAWDKAGGDMARSAREHTAEVMQSFTSMTQSVIGSLRGMVDAFKHGDIWEGLTQLVDVLAQIAGAISGSGGFAGFGGGGGLSKSSSGGGLGALKGFASGGSFRVGGMPGLDRNLVAFRATKGETVDIRRPGNDNGGGSRPMVFDLRGAVLTEDLLNQMNAMADGAKLAGAAGGLALSRQHFAKQKRRSFRQ